MISVLNDILKNANDVNLAFSKGVVQFHTLHSSKMILKNMPCWFCDNDYNTFYLQR